MTTSSSPSWWTRSTRPVASGPRSASPSPRLSTNGTSRHQPPAGQRALHRLRPRGTRGTSPRRPASCSAMSPSRQTSSAIASRSAASGRRHPLHHHVDRIADRDRGAVGDQERGAERRDLGRERADRALAAGRGLDLALAASPLAQRLALRDPRPAPATAASTAGASTGAASLGLDRRRCDLVRVDDLNERGVGGKRAAPAPPAGPFAAGRPTTHGTSRCSRARVAATYSSRSRSAST